MEKVGSQAYLDKTENQPGHEIGRTMAEAIIISNKKRREKIYETRV
jgi:hypothetical protein